MCTVIIICFAVTAAVAVAVPSQLTNDRTVSRTRTMTLTTDERPHCVAHPSYLIGGIILVLLFLMYPGNHDGLFGSGSHLPPEDVSAVTWNMAAINNNPFEYWITNDDPNYGE